MISAIVALGMVLLLIVSGRFFDAFKKLTQLIVKIVLKILNHFGMHVKKREYRLHVSRQFKKTFKDIRVVKRSKSNNKLKPSINIFALILLFISLLLLVINLEAVSGNAISIWLFNHNPIPKFITSQRNMDMTFTAALFSVITFSLSKLASQWKETKKDRQARREVKKQKYILRNLSSKDLLDIARAKDLESYNKAASDYGRKGS